MAPFSDIPIGNILPQQPPFRFVDTLELYSPEETRVAFVPGEGNLLMEGDTLSAAGLLEHMAQASAARVGYHCRYVLHVPVSIGYIGQVRKYVIHRLPKAGERIETSVFLQQEIFRISLSEIVVKAGEELIATATLKTALKDD